MASEANSHLEINNPWNIRADLIDLTDNSAFHESVSAPLTTRLIEGGNIWPAEHLIVLLDRQLRLYTRRNTKGGAHHENVFAEFGAYIVNAVIQPTKAAMAIELWDERVTQIANKQSIGRETKQAHEPPKPGLPLQKRLGRSSLVGSNAAPRLTESESGEPLRKKFLPKGMKPAITTTSKKSASSGGRLKSSTRAVFSQPTRLSHAKKPVFKGPKRGNGHRGYSPKTAI